MFTLAQAQSPHHFQQNQSVPNLFNSSYGAQPMNNQHMQHPNLGMAFQRPSNFYENLVSKMDPMELSTLSMELKRGVDTDLESRSEWEEGLASGIKQLGWTKDNNSEDYTASAGVFSNAFSLAILTAHAQYCSVMLPPSGPANIKLTNKIKDKKILEFLMDKADSAAGFINTLLTDLSADYYPESEQAFWWALLYGSSFKKAYFDHTHGLPVSRLIKPQDLIVNSNAISLLNAARITYRFYINFKELKMNQMMGLWADVPLSTYKNYEESPIDQILGRIEKIDKSTSPGIKNITDMYEICETRENRVIKAFQRNPNIPCPYMITFEKQTGTILSIYRNWLQEDPFCKRINDIIHYKLLPGFGLFGQGYIHLMGSTAETATELLRQLIFSSKMANFPAFIRSKGMRMDKSTILLQPGESAEIETGNKSIQDCFMKVPVEGPTPLFKEIKDNLEENIGSLSNSLNTAFNDMNANASFSKTFAVIEQYSKVETSIIKRLHKGMSEELNLIYKLIYQNFDQIKYSFESSGKNIEVTKDDFYPNFQILPVSDPNLSTATHLLMQSEALTEVYQQFPQLVNARPIVELKLKALKIPNTMDFIIADQAETAPRDPITENIDLIEGKPANASIEQNHQAHIQTHNGLLTNPAVMSDPNKMAVIQAHIQQHYAMDYQIQMQQLMNGQQIPQGGQPEDMQMQNHIAEQAAQATQQLMQQQQQALNAGQPQQPDPTMVLMADIKSKEDAMNQKAENDFLRAQIDQYKIDADMLMKEKELDAKYRDQESQQEHEQNLMEQQLWNQNRISEHETIQSQITEIMNKFHSLNEQEAQQAHEKQMQKQQQMHDQMQQQNDQGYQQMSQQMDQQQQSLKE